MMQNIKTGEGQIVLDIAMQYCGDVSKSLEICLLNNISITDVFSTGTILKVPSVAIEKERIVNEFKSKLLVPASNEDDIDSLPTGIGYWIIGEDFIVQ